MDKNRSKIEERKQPTLPANLHSPKPTAIRWREVPMFRVSMAFIPGMIVADLTGIPMVAWLAAFFFSTAIGAGQLRLRIRNFRTVLVMSLSFFLGGLIVTSQKILHSTQVLNTVSGSPYKGIISDIAPYSSGFKATLFLLPQPPTTLTHVISQGTRLLTRLAPSQKVLVYFTQCGEDLSIADTITFSKTVSLIQPPQSDFEFNAALYYSSLGIHHRVFLRPGDFTHNTYYGFSLRKSSNKIRELISCKIKDRIHDRASAAIMIAMLIGDKSNIDTDLKTSYRKSGAIHILAISGLHIGIVASILIGIFGLPIPQRSPLLAALKATTVLGGIWSFAWISGMSPSATRAAFMFTIYLLGVLFMRKAQILNILGFTAFVLLVREPFLLHSLGFQFSFLALSGIVVWGMPILRSYSFKNRIFQYGWSIIAISLGAQILIAPALLYYFNEISIVSPITSLISIPAAYLIVLGGILMLVVEMIMPIMGTAIGGLLSFGISLLNQFFTAFSDLPFSTLSHIYITANEGAVLATVMLLASFRILAQRKFWLTLTIPLSLLFAVIHCQSYLRKTASPQLTIYSSKTEFALDLITPGMTQTTLNLYHADKYTIQAARHNRIQHYARINQLIGDDAEYSESALLAIKISLRHSAPVHLIYIGSEPGNLSIPPEQMTYVILSKGLDYKIARRLTYEINRPHLVVHDMRKQGAFKLYLS